MISIETLSKEVLIDLHDKITDRLRYLDQMEAQNEMTNFYYGDVVTFTTNDGKAVTGKIEKFNQKSVSLRTDTGHKWRVAPQYLRKVSTSVLTIPYQNLGS